LSRLQSGTLKQSSVSTAQPERYRQSPQRSSVGHGDAPFDILHTASAHPSTHSQLALCQACAGAVQPEQLTDWLALVH